MKSMTGYGSAAIESEALTASVSMRSLNHRYLEVTLRLSRSLQALEREIKAVVESRVGRGRIDVAARASFREAGGDVVTVTRPLVASLVRALREIHAKHALAGEVSISDIARFPGTLEVVEGEVDESRRHQILDLVGRALDELEGMRRSEGTNLAGHLLRCLAAIEAAAGRIESLSSSGRGARNEALLEKARGLAADLGLDEARLYAEIVRLVDRADVAEEVQRLRSHVALARDLIGAEAPAGKRLDFLAQELMREANTVGSKSASAPLTHEVVALKSEIEKLREQVQNVE
jgi:uncharacterized protein (TIGR00255 family)